MNPEMVEMYRAVQKYRGEWQLGDRFCYLHPIVNQWCIVTVIDEMIDHMDLPPYDEAVWLPPTAPRWPGDEGRNLWEMVDWKKWYIHVNDNNLVAMYLKDIGGGIAFIEAPTLPEVLLVALQWEGNYDEVTK